MKKSLLLLFAISAILGMSGALVACDDSSAPPVAPTDNNGESKVTAIPVDYSAGRAMNKRLESTSATPGIPTARMMVVGATLSKMKTSR